MTAAAAPEAPSDSTLPQPSRSAQPSEHQTMASASSVLAVAMLLASAANYVVNLVLARLLDPAAFGDASLMVTTMLALTSLAVGVQLYTVKLVAGCDASAVAETGRRLRENAVVAGTALGGALCAASPWLSSVLNTESALPFVALGLGMPAFLWLSVDRGLLQGTFRFGRLARTYLVEAGARTGLSILLVVLGGGATGATLGLALSFVAASFSARPGHVPLARIDGGTASSAESRASLGPLAVLLAAQVVINNGDVIMSKQLFDPETAGAYAAVALVGRAVFFASWSIVQAAFPAAVTADDHDRSVGTAATVMVGAIGLVSVVAMYALAPLVAEVLFGDSFPDLAQLLGPYAAATALFAVANVMATIDVAANRTALAWLLLTGAVAQTLAIAAFANTPSAMIDVQIVAMATLLFAVGSTRAIQSRHASRTGHRAHPHAPGAAARAAAPGG